MDPFDFWTNLRIFVLVMLFGSFMAMMYLGVYRLTVHGRRSFRVERFLNLLWVAIMFWTVAELAVIHAEPGPRVILQAIVSIVQLVAIVWLIKNPAAEHCPECDCSEKS